MKKICYCHLLNMMNTTLLLLLHYSKSKCNEKFFCSELKMRTSKGKQIGLIRFLIAEGITIFLIYWHMLVKLSLFSTGMSLTSCRSSRRYSTTKRISPETDHSSLIWLGDLIICYRKTNELQKKKFL